jgi:hypothetical protein
MRLIKGEVLGTYFRPPLMTGASPRAQAIMDCFCRRRPQGTPGTVDAGANEGLN